MRALRLEAVIVHRLRLGERNELGEAEIEDRAHAALPEVVGHLVLGCVFRLRIPRLLLLRELLRRAQRVAALACPSANGCRSFLSCQCPAPRYVRSIRASREQLGRRAVEGDAAILQHVAMIGDAQHLAHVLLGDQDRRAGFDESRGRDRGSCRRPSAPGRATARRAAAASGRPSARARAPASAARRPTGTPPAVRSARSGSETSDGRASSAAARAVRSVCMYAPSSRFSRTVIGPNSIRPCGTWITPCRTIASGDAPPSSRWSNVIRPPRTGFRPGDGAQQRRLARAVRTRARRRSRRSGTRQRHALQHVDRRVARAQRLNREHRPSPRRDRRRSRPWLRWISAGVPSAISAPFCMTLTVSRERHHHAHVVLDDQQRDALRFGERARRRDRAIRLGLAHAGGRLVHQQQRRPRRERAGQVHPLQHAERQFGRRHMAIAPAARSARGRRAPRGSPRSRVGARRESRAPPRRNRPAARRPTPTSTLSSTDSSANGSTCWNVRPMPRRLIACAGAPDTRSPSSRTIAGVDRHHAGDRIDHRRLAGTVGTNQAAYLAARDAQRQVAHGDDAAEAHRQRFDGETVGHGRASAVDSRSLRVIRRAAARHSVTSPCGMKIRNPSRISV